METPVPSASRRVRRGADGAGVELRVPYFALGDPAGGDEHQVWGATAMILGEFGALLDPEFGPGPAPEFTDTARITLI